MSEKWFPSIDGPDVVGRFETVKRIDAKASREADEEVFRDVIVLREKIVGQRDESVRPLKPHSQRDLIRRYPDAWRAFEGEEVEDDGTPLSELGIEGDKALLFRINGVCNVEQLAKVSDATCDALGFGSRKLRQQAADLIAGDSDGEDRVVPIKRRRGRPRKDEIR